MRKRQKIYSYAVSVKGVLVRDGKVLLMQHEGDEWELPGGRIEPGETPQSCVAREIHEETGLAVTAGPILHSWLHRIERAGGYVFIVVYGCHSTDLAEPVISHEHKDMGWFTPAEVPALPMPEGHKIAIRTWFDALAA
jgi:8-oxo-dGTP pyrophosphatase MutT (NUDIX family)